MCLLQNKLHTTLLLFPFFFPHFSLWFVLAAEQVRQPFWLDLTVPHVTQLPADGRAHCGESCTSFLSRLGKSLLSLLVSVERGRKGRRGKDGERHVRGKQEEERWFGWK